jgi:hypothetical protein
LRLAKGLPLPLFTEYPRVGILGNPYAALRILIQ